MELHLLPVRHAGAAENMAVDFLLLQRYPEPTHARFRHYGWHRPAFTFGYGQKIAFVSNALPADEGPFDLCRRPTGGGLVDHRDDWTYALVLPRGHALYDARAVESYRTIHACLTDVLRGQGCPAGLKTTCEPGPCASAPGVCFRRAEQYDVIHEATAEKIAGAALKRSRHGLLFQGSLWRPAAGGMDWDAFSQTFAVALAKALALDAVPCGWPEFAEEELSALTEQYASAGWNDHR